MSFIGLNADVDKIIKTIPGIITNKIIRLNEVLTDRKPDKYGRVKQNSWTIYVGLSELDGKTIQEFLNCRDLTNISEMPDAIFSFCEDITIDAFAGEVNIVKGGKPVNAFTIVDTHMVGSKHKFGSGTIVKTGKNIGRSNATNKFTQAIKDAISKRNDKDNSTKYIWPQLANGDAILNKPENIEKDIKALFSRDIFLQKKIDGTRCLAMIDEDSGEIDAYSRSCKPIVLGRAMSEELKVLLKAMTVSGIKPILDGELYKHGYSLNQINGIVNGHATAEAMYKKDLLEYIIFDVILTKGGRPTKAKFADRLSVLENNKDLFTDHLQLVETIKPSSAEEVIKLYKAAFDEGYEGLMMRYNNPYATTHNDRSNMVKLKPLFSYEFPITGYKSGTGKHADMIIYKCGVTADFLSDIIEYKRKKDESFSLDLDKAIGSEFSVQTKGMTDEESKAEYKKMKQKMDDGRSYFEVNILGKMATIEFQDVSDDGIPLRAKFVSLR